MIRLNADFSKVGLAARSKPEDLAFKVLGAKAKTEARSVTQFVEKRNLEQIGSYDKHSYFLIARHDGYVSPGLRGHI